MSNLYIFSIEIILTAAIIFGFIVENEIATFEKKLFKKIKKLFKGVKN